MDVGLLAKLLVYSNQPLLIMSNKRPHIIIFNPDQWRGDVLGHLGNPAAVTPNFDQGAATDFVSFRHAFCQNPVCTPSRCSFMTGWYPHVRGHRSMSYMLRQKEGEPCLLQKLKDNGYFIWWGGKNDLVPAEEGWDSVSTVRFQPRGPLESLFMMDRSDEWRGEPDSDSYYSMFAGELPITPGYNHYHDFDWAVVQGAIDQILNYQGEEPLCLYLSLVYPHPPYAVERCWREMIDEKCLPSRLPWPGDEAGLSPILSEIRKRQGLLEWDEERWDELRAVYYGMCARVDHQFGLIMDALREAGIYDNTAVFAFSDHGDFTGDYGLVEKVQSTFQDCLIRVPFMIKLPGAVQGTGRVENALVELIDFTATVYDLTGIEPGYDHFGKSLLPILLGQTEAHRNAVFCEGGCLANEPQSMEFIEKGNPSESLYWPRLGLQQDPGFLWNGKAAMCRTRQYKYIGRLAGSDELYDLVSDPGEQHNRINDPALEEIKFALRERLLRWYLETADVVPRDMNRRQ